MFNKSLGNEKVRCGEERGDGGNWKEEGNHKGVEGTGIKFELT